MTNRCYCTPAEYCPDDNVTYPPIQCDYCIERENEDLEREHRRLEEELLLKPISNEIVTDDDLPF